MSFFSGFIKKKNRINELVGRLSKKKQTENLEEELLKMRSFGLSEDEEKSWHLYYGIAAFQRKDRETAFQRFKKASLKYPDDPSIQFSLGQEYEYKGETEAMVESFHKSKFPSVSAQHALAETRYAYLWNKIEDGLEFIEPIFRAYFKLRVADDTFLYLRGFPFFSDTWGYYIALSWLKKDMASPQERISYCKQNLQSYDFSWLELNLNAMINNDFSRVIDEGKKRIELNKKNKLPYSFSSLKNVIFECKMLNDYSRAKALLEGINFKLDFPWLADVITLAKAGLAYKFKNDETETKLINTFFQEQPLLLEPDHAVYFGLLDYQERLKKIYAQNKNVTLKTLRSK